MSETQSKMWSGRFREPLDPAFERWQRSFPFDWRLLPQEIAASRAHAHAIAAANILTGEELTTTLEGLDAIIPAALAEAARHYPPPPDSEAGARLLEDAGPGIVALAPEVEDVHHFVELALQRQIGDLALKLHTGRSRNEQIATDLRLYVRGAIDVASRDLRAWALALVTKARAAGDAVMPSYTHLQRAEPVLVAHWLLAYVSMAERDLSRLANCRKRLNLCPLGSGAIAGATLALDRTIAAAMLGFDGPTANSMDATSDRDFALEFAQVAAIVGVHLSRFAEEITLFSTAEYGFVELPERFSTGSSAMPQKKNPDLTELLRGKSGRLIGGSQTLAIILKGLPLAYNKDMQETQEASFDVADTLLGLLPLLAPFTAALAFKLERMSEAANKGYLNAMAAATYLVHKGVPFRLAHEKIGHAVRFGLEQGKELNQLSLSELRQFGEEVGDDFKAAITTEATLDCHDVLGGTARNQVAAALESAERRLSSVQIIADTGVSFGR